MMLHRCHDEGAPAALVGLRAVVPPDMPESYQGPPRRVQCFDALNDALHLQIPVPAPTRDALDLMGMPAEDTLSGPESHVGTPPFFFEEAFQIASVRIL